MTPRPPRPAIQGRCPACGHASLSLADDGTIICGRDECPDIGALQNLLDPMVVLRRKADGTPAVWCDRAIADIVQALNAGGVPTVASCSGHGVRPGNVALADGRELIVAADWHEAREVEAAFPRRAGEDGR